MGRSLADLYVMGREVKIDDGQGEPVVVWLSKLTELEYSETRKKADATRARFLLNRRFPDSDEHLAVLGQVLAMSRDERLRQLGDVERGRIQAQIVAEVANEEEWDKDSYLDGLRTAWNDGLRDDYATGDDDKPVEASRVHDELERFGTQVRQRLDVHVESYVKDMKDLSDEKLEGKMLDEIYDLRGSSAWVLEMRRQQVLFATRDPEDHSQRVFPDRASLDSLHGPTLATLMSEYSLLEVEPFEGKGSAGNPSSSLSSEPSEPEETGDSSGPQESTESSSFPTTSPSSSDTPILSSTGNRT